MFSKLQINKRVVRSAFLAGSIFLLLLLLFHIAFVINPLSISFRDYFPSGVLPTEYTQEFNGVLALSLITIASIAGYFAYKRFLKFRNLIRSEKFLVSVLMTISLLFALVLYLKYINFRTYTFDLVIDYQAIANSARGEFFKTTVEVPNLLGDHFSLLLLIPTIFYIVFPNVLTLFFYQALSIGFGAWGIYKLAFLVLKNKLISILFALIFILYPSLSGGFLYDFHEVVLAIPFLIWGIYFYHTKKTKLFIISFILAALAKEDVGIFIGSFGLYILLVNRDKKGIWLLGGYFWSLLTMLVLIPTIRQGPSDTLSRYEYWGTTGVDIAKNIITKPLEALKYSLEEAKVIYLLKLFIPTGFLSFFAPLTLIIFLPTLLVNLLTAADPQFSNLFHYDVMNSVGIFYASILGLKNLQLLNSRLGVNSAKIFLVCLIPLNGFILFTHPVWQDIEVLLTPQSQRYQDFEAIQNLKSKMNSNSSVYTSNATGPFFAEYPNYRTVYESPDQEVDYVVIDKKDALYKEKTEAAVERYISDRDYITIFESEGLIILQKP